jgi:hypothetical protein
MATRKGKLVWRPVMRGPTAPALEEYHREAMALGGAYRKKKVLKG